MDRNQPTHHDEDDADDEHSALHISTARERGGPVTDEKGVDVVLVGVIVLVKGDDEQGTVDEVVFMKARSQEGRDPPGRVAQSGVVTYVAIVSDDE